MFTRLGRQITRHPLLTVLAWILIAGGGYAMAVLGVHGESLFDRVSTGAPAVAGSQSARADQILDEHFADGENITLLVSGVDPADPAVASAMATINEKLASVKGSQPPINPYVFPDSATNPDAQPWISSTGEGFLVAVQLEPGLSDAAAADAATRIIAILDSVPEAIAQATDAPDEVTGIVSSTDHVMAAITDQVRADLATGEIVALPIALVIMVFVFGGFLAAAMPMAGAFASIGAGLGALLGITYLMEVEAAVVNVVTVLALGLSIDYGLLIVSRFREELHRGLAAEPDHSAQRSRRRDSVSSAALVETMRTAGRTVTFSALTVAISIAGLMVFRPEILRSVGAGGLAAVIIAVATAITLVPALLVFTGHRLARPSMLSKIPGVRRLTSRTVDVQTDDGFLSRLAAKVQRHPWWVTGATIVVLGVLAFPVTGLQMRNSGVELLPAASSQRQFVDDLASDYAIEQLPTVTIVAGTSPEAADAWATQIAQLPDIELVDTALVADQYVRLGVRLTPEDPGSPEAISTVNDIRALDPGFDFWVTGQAASQIDFLDALKARIWWAIAIVVAATFTLLFLMTGSVVIPLKALLTNAVSLAASLGVLVWAFQDGHLKGLLDFTPTGGIETYVVAMVIAFAFGLAMDYEVFLLARIKELHDSGLSNNEAVRIGLQRSGRIITSAAAIIVVVFAGFMAGELLVIKQVGFALAVAVIIDATLVRLLLVPATMTLLGTYNWWAPKPLRAVYATLRLTH